MDSFNNDRFNMAIKMEMMPAGRIVGFEYMAPKVVFDHSITKLNKSSYTYAKSKAVTPFDISTYPMTFDICPYQVFSTTRTEGATTNYAFVDIQ